MSHTWEKGLSEVQGDAKKDTTLKKGPKVYNKQLKMFEQAIYSRCKESLGESLNEILILVPEASLSRKLSSVEKQN